MGRGLSRGRQGGGKTLGCKWACGPLGRAARLTCCPPTALSPPFWGRSLRIRAWLMAWAAACEVREGAGPLRLGLTWKGEVTGSLEGAVAVTPVPTHHDSPLEVHRGLYLGPRGLFPASWGQRLKLGCQALSRNVPGGTRGFCGVGDHPQS